MTAEAVVIERNLAQIGIAQTAVGVVTICAGGLTFGDGVVGGQTQLRTYLLVAVKANLLRLQAGRTQITLPVQIVAAVAAKIFLLVLTASPKYLIAFFMAVLATGAACVGVRWPSWTEAHIRCAIGGCVQVALAGTVTSRAAGIAPAGEIPVYGVVYGVNGHVGAGGMAIQALCIARIRLAILGHGTTHEA